MFFVRSLNTFTTTTKTENVIDGDYTFFFLDKLRKRKAHIFEKRF
jgi:hypothetical protein